MFGDAAMSLVKVCGTGDELNFLTTTQTGNACVICCVDGYEQLSHHRLHVAIFSDANRLAEY